MKYPTFMRKINKACSIVGGLCVCMIAILTVTEAILRIFGHPTSWSSDITVYMLLVAIFLSSAYAFQEKGHIAVDFVQQAAGRVFGLKARKPMVIAGYLCAMFFIAVLTWRCILLLQAALLLHKLTYATMQIPISYLYGAMIFGCVLMLATIMFILLDVLTDSEDYL